MTLIATPAQAKYVIISDGDAPQPNMICEWVPGKGYCYLDRSGTKPRHDGMKGAEATSVEDFGILYAENSDGTVSFYKSDRASVARYSDGEPREWQSKVSSWTYPRIRRAALSAVGDGGVG